MVFFYAFGVRVATVASQVVKTSLEKGRKAGFAAEAKKFGELAMTRQSKALMGLFFGQTECKKNQFGAPAKPVQCVSLSLPSFPTCCTALQKHVQFSSSVSLAMNTVLYSSRSCFSSSCVLLAHVRKLAILGAGLMGAGIAQVSLNKGMQILVKDMNSEAIGRGLHQIQKNYSDLQKKRKMTPCVQPNH